MSFLVLKSLYLLKTPSYKIIKLLKESFCIVIFPHISSLLFINHCITLFRFVSMFDLFPLVPLVCNYTNARSYGTFKSPFYPEYYPDNALCYYHLETIPGRIFKIDLRVFHLQKSPNCTNDSFKMYENGTLKETICGSIYKTLRSSDNKVLFVFKSDGAITNQGFDVSFSVETKRKYFLF